MPMGSYDIMLLLVYALWWDIVVRSVFGNSDRFCNTMATVAPVDTSIQSD